MIKIAEKIANPLIASLIELRDGLRDRLAVTHHAR
jgi:hypothetical protein